MAVANDCHISPPHQTGQRFFWANQGNRIFNSETGANDDAQDLLFYLPLPSLGARNNASSTMQKTPDSIRGVQSERVEAAGGQEGTESP